MMIFKYHNEVLRLNNNTIYVFPNNDIQVKLKQDEIKWRHTQIFSSILKDNCYCISVSIVCKLFIFNINDIFKYISFR